jgi:CheY-like chemotaxis protein
MHSPKTFPKRRVLVVDDNADAALVLSMCLNAYGHETAVAYDGREGIDLAESFEPEVIFLDLGMPQMSGTRWSQNCVDVQSSLGFISQRLLAGMTLKPVTR